MKRCFVSFVSVVAAAHGTLFADTISLQQAQSIVHNYELLELAPHKAVWLVIFANSMHPNLPIVATFKLTEFGKALKRQFELAWVNGFDRKCRQTFLVDGKTSDQGRVVADFIKAVKMAQASQGQTPMPVLIGQAQVLSVGWDGLQVRFCSLVVSPACLCTDCIGQLASAQRQRKCPETSIHRLN